MSRQRSFVFEITKRCNHDCLQCYNAWKNLQPYPSAEDLPTDKTIDILGKMLDETGARLVSLSGGEPMLRADIFEIVDYLRERNTTVNLITNGSLMTETAINRLADKISVFELPLLSAEREVHDRLSGIEGAFDRAVMAMAELKAAQQIVVGVFVATRLNLPGWRETMELAIAIGLDGVMFNRFNPGGRGREHVGLLQSDPDEILRALDIAEEMSAKYEAPVSCSIPMPPCLFDTSRYKRLTFGYCAAGTERAYYTLDPVGNVRPCNHSPTVLGNIREASFESMCEGIAMRQFAAARPAFCSGCALEEKCLGGCKAAAEACFGDIGAMDPFLAAYHSCARKRQIT
jgi:radical SAM protein with 4Fe4S-binding SPASM domain